MAAASGPNVVEDGLVLALDAGNTKSYDNPTITYVGGTSDSDNSSSFTLSGLQSGDLVLYFSAEDGANVNTPTGASWTAIPGLTTQPDNDNDPNSAAFYVFATGTSVTASGLATGNSHVRVMIAFRNVNSTNPFDVNATENSGSGLPDPPSITPVTDNSMIVAVGLLDDHDIANSISPPTGYTTALNMDSQGGANDGGLGGATIMTAYKLLATAAAEDPGGFTGLTGDPNKGISIALKPVISSTWTDIIGNNNGTLTNEPTFGNGNGGAIVFDGTNDYCEHSSGWTSFGTDPFSIEIWFRAHTQSPAETIIGTNNTGTGTFDIGFDSSAKIKFWAQDSGGGYANAVSSTTLNVWEHLIFVREGTGTNQFKIYKDGSLDTTGTVDTNFNSTAQLRIARSRNGSYYYDGDLSLVRIYKNKALTAVEVEQNYNANKGRYA